MSLQILSKVFETWSEKYRNILDTTNAFETAAFPAGTSQQLLVNVLTPLLRDRRYTELCEKMQTILKSIQETEQIQRKLLQANNRQSESPFSLECELALAMRNLKSACEDFDSHLRKQTLMEKHTKSESIYDKVLSQPEPDPYDYNDIIDEVVVVDHYHYYHNYSEDDKRKTNIFDRYIRELDQLVENIPASNQKTKKKYRQSKYISRNVSTGHGDYESENDHVSSPRPLTLASVGTLFTRPNSAIISPISAVPDEYKDFFRRQRSIRESRSSSGTRKSSHTDGTINRDLRDIMQCEDFLMDRQGSDSSGTQISSYGKQRKDTRRNPLSKLFHAFLTKVFPKKGQRSKVNKPLPLVIGTPYNSEHLAHVGGKKTKSFIKSPSTLSR